MPRIALNISLPTLNLLRLESEIASLREAGVEEFYLPVMDGSFAPLVEGGVAFVQAVKAMDGACHVHFMVERPERHFMRYIDAGADAVTVHAEACMHLHRTLTQIRETGADAGVALKPATPLIQLEYALDLADRVTLLASDPGFDAKASIENVFDRVRILAEIVKLRGHKVQLEIAGAFDLGAAAKLSRLGAHAFVLPRVLFAEPNQAPGEGLDEFRAALEVQRELV